MSNDMTQVGGGGSEWFGEEEPEGSGPPAPVNPLLIVHRCLRGRYLLAIVLAGALGVPCAVLGYVAVPPKYTSTGQVTIAPRLPYLMYQNELNEPLSAYDSFLQSQANVLRGNRVLNNAMSDQKLQAAGWTPAPHGTIELSDGLSVVVPRSGQDIFVSVEHTDPAKAQAAVNAVLKAYEQIVTERELKAQTGTINSLKELQKQYANEAEDAREGAFAIAVKEGTDDLQTRRDAKHEHWARLDRLIDEYTLELVRYEKPSGDAPGGPRTAPAPGVIENDGAPIDNPEQPAQEKRSEAELEMLASGDMELARLLMQREQTQLEIKSLRSRYADGHRAVVSALSDLEVINVLIEDRAAVVAANPTAPGGSAGSLSPAITAQQLSNQLQKLLEMRDRTRDEAQRLGVLQVQIERFRAQEARAEEQRRLAESRLTALEVEQREGSIGRITIPEGGNPPLQPSTDRRIPLAAMGAMGGGGLGVAMVVALGFFSPKYRYIDDIEGATRNVFVFGAIPELDPADPESRELVAASIHQVRSVIDARLLGTRERATVHVVTSAGTGEGKSTIALRLAKSFAATGRRTLLIDADMIGQRLTAEFGMLGRAGFADAVTARALDLPSVHETPVRDLHLMPCGRTDRVEPEEISANRAGDMLATLQADFHAIVIDTGPVLGSLEAQAVAAVADEVMLVVTRGREVRNVKMAIDRLHRLGARKIGVVFNRATRNDIERSTSVSITSQRAADARSQWHDHTDAHTANGHAPVARLESAPTTED